MPELTPPTLFDRMLQTNADPVSQTAEDTAEAEASNAELLKVDTPDGTGRLSPEVRHALIYLLRQGVVRFATKRNIFEQLQQHELLVNDHLADMYLRMLIDERAGIIVLLQNEIDEDEEEESRALMNRRTLSIDETLTLIILRKYFQEREAAGEQQIFIDTDWLNAQLVPYSELSNSSKTEQRRLSGLINSMKEWHILATVRGESDRFEILPVIRYVVSAEALAELLAEYQRIIATATA